MVYNVMAPKGQVTCFLFDTDVLMTSNGYFIGIQICPENPQGIRNSSGCKFLGLFHV